MCTKSPASPSLPPPPPPPPPAPPLQSSNNSVNSVAPEFGNLQPLLEGTHLCYWANSDLELKRTCIFNQICTRQPPYKIKYKKFEPIIQVGPTCGIVALSMLINGKLSPDEILKMSKFEGYSRNGEMFSCNNMAKLCERVFRAAGIKDMSVKVHRRSLFSPETVESLLNGAVFLVPYDTDVNYIPALNNGHTAHWAVICGVIILNKPGARYAVEKKNIYVLGQHGKSKYMYAWDLAQLARSNNNLWEISPKKQNDAFDYVIPEGGIGGKNGLRGQFLQFPWRLT